MAVDRGPPRVGGFAAHALVTNRLDGMSRVVDFLRTPSTQAVGWVLMAAGAIAITSALMFHRHVAEKQDEVAQLAQARQEIERRVRQPVRVAEPSAAERRLQRAVTEAKAPWLRTLRAIESSAQAPVFLRSLAIDPATGVVKVEAEAPAFADAVAFAEALGSDPTLRPALLTSHELVTDPASAGPVVRFGVAARWNRF
jgi:hypothetical protein